MAQAVPSRVVRETDARFPSPDAPQFTLRAEHAPLIGPILALADAIPESCFALLSAEDRNLLTLAIEQIRSTLEHWRTVDSRERRLTGGPAMLRIDGRHPIAILRALLAKCPDAPASETRGLAADDRALLDALTGIPNRGAFDRDLATLIERATATADPLSLVMVDVDHFKKINDTHGHPKGDEVLKGVVAQLSAVVRGKGREYRYGGEEMTLLLPNHARDEAVMVAERARMEIAEVPVGGIAVTASFGVATIPDHAATAETLVGAADKALYVSKHHGRNCVYYSGEKPRKPDAPPTVKRRTPDSKGLTDEERERVRLEYFRSHAAHCPRDDAILDVEVSRTAGFVCPNLFVACPVCGLNANILAERIIGPAR